MELIYDPRTIQASEGVFIVASNQINSWIGKVIDFKTDINVPGVFPTDHFMSLITPGKFASQQLTYAEVPMENYLIPGGQLWFIQLVNANPAFNDSFIQSVQKRLNLPAILKTYDFLGIFGQAISCPWIHTPFLDYCSVDVVSHLKDASPNLPAKDNGFIQGIENESNPEQITDDVVSNDWLFNIKYFWNSNQGITV